MVSYSIYNAVIAAPVNVYLQQTIGETRMCRMCIPCWSYTGCRPFLFICGDGLEQSRPLLQPIVGLLYQPWIIDGGDCETISGMNEWLGKQKYWDKTGPVPLCPPQIPHNFTWVRNRAAAGCRP
jgi:hypothetical protein